MVHLIYSFPVESNNRELIFEHGEDVRPCKFCGRCTEVRVDVSLNIPGDRVSWQITKGSFYHCGTWHVCPNCFGEANEQYNALADEADARWESDRRSRISDFMTPIHITPTEFFDLSTNEGTLRRRDGVWK